VWVMATELMCQDRGWMLHCCTRLCGLDHPSPGLTAFSKSSGWPLHLHLRPSSVIDKHNGSREDPVHLMAFASLLQPLSSTVFSCRHLHSTECCLC
jgi:hypothetical protein